MGSSDRQHTAIVVGAGISGLCTAYWLKKQGVNVTVLERESTQGGTMKTIHDNGWMIESGPNSALETTPLIKELLQETGTLEEQRYANEAAAKRYVVRRGGLHAIPMSPGAFFSTKLWTIGGKLRLLKEPFVGRAGKEETIAEFVTRRLGREFLDYAINPFVAGVYAGNPEQLSVQAAFPKLYALEEKYGGLVKGAMRSRKERKARKEVAKDRARLFSFDQGMEVFPRGLANALGSAIKFNCRVEHIIPMRAGKNPVYTLRYVQDAIPQTAEAEAVILSAPAYVTAGMIRSIDPATAAMLDQIFYPPVAEVFLGVQKEQVGRSLDGFGFLMPAAEQRKILGSIWSSALFPHRAPDGYAALTTFVGGARQPEVLAASDDELILLVLSELRSLMNITGDPAYARVIRWEKAIPQYNVGYYKTLHAIDRFEENFRGAFICSNYRGGIAVGDCVMNAEKIAARIKKFFADS